LMYQSADGGGTWAPMPALDAVMRGNGDFPIKNQRGPTDFTGMNGYHQPSFVAFDPFDANTIIAGGPDSGIFLTMDNGASWSVVTDPRNSDWSGRPHIPRSRHAYFSQANHSKSIYVSSQGRGVWRLGLCDGDVYEGDDDLAHAKPITSGVPQSRSICSNTESDFATFTVSERVAYAIETASPAGDPVLALRAADGSLLRIDDNGAGNGRDARIQGSCTGGYLTPGTYYIEGFESGRNALIANYTLSLVLTPCCGNGATDAGEGCDDGNRVSGDCCSAACAAEPSQMHCNNGESCTVNDVCNGLGSCSGVRPSHPSQLGAVSMTTSLLSWPAQSLASGYDVVSGDLGILRQSGGNFAAATTSCLADDSAATHIDHSTLVPGPGDARFFLVRAVNCSGPGSYDEGYSQVAPRDGGIEASPGRCTTSCVAGRCLSGAPFSGACSVDPCISEICATYPGCCTTSWDATCVDAVRSVCSSLTCRASAPA